MIADARFGAIVTEFLVLCANPREPGNHIPEPRKCNEYSASSICHRHRPHDDSSPKSRYNITIIYVAHLYVDIIVINTYIRHPLSSHLLHRGTLSWYNWL